MIETRAEIEVTAALAAAWAVVWDVARYPEFLSDVIAVNVTPGPTPLEVEAGFEMRVFRTRSFRLRLHGEPPDRLRWTLMDGQHLRANEGEWVLKTTAPGRVQMAYLLALDTSVPVPDAIARRLIEFNLPTALRQFKARIETRNATTAALPPVANGVQDHG